MLDKDKGGHFTINPGQDQLCTTKQHYLPSSNILQTRYLHEDGVMNVVDFFPRPNNKANDAEFHAKVLRGKQRGEVLNPSDERSDLKKWLVRRVECMRDQVDVNVEVFPAFSKCNLTMPAMDLMNRRLQLQIVSSLGRAPFVQARTDCCRLRTR